jgi:type VI protein secretion system component Hcp
LLGWRKIMRKTNDTGLTNKTHNSKASLEVRELSEAELEMVSGGKVMLQDIHFVKVLDKASPILFG